MLFPGHTPTALRLRVTAGDWALVMFGMLVATVTAMSALYVGKAFGTGFDYLVAFLWGAGVDQGLRGIVAILGKLGATLSLGATTPSSGAGGNGTVGTSAATPAGSASQGS
ncbi:MAG: hypothetical protein M3Y58_08290 [Chloroflexota bacterium]|nr:hypothetical protein [Chloroflexota bacterium]